MAERKKFEYAIYENELYQKQFNDNLLISNVDGEIPPSLKSHSHSNLSFDGSFNFQ